MERILLYLLCFKCCRQCAHQAEETSRAGKFNFIVDYKMSWSICTQGQTSEPLLMCVCVCGVRDSHVVPWEYENARSQNLVDDDDDEFWPTFFLCAAPQKKLISKYYLSQVARFSRCRLHQCTIYSLSLSHVSFAHTLSRQGNSNVLSVSFTVFFFDVVLVGWCCVQPFPLHYHFGNDDKRD